jgi:hypothetical protein
VTRTRACLGVVSAGAVVLLLGVMNGRGPQAAVVAKPTVQRPAVFVAPTGSDANSCRTRTLACATFNRAYQVARPGEIVEVAGGSYPGQVIVAAANKAAPNIVFRPAERARVILDGLEFGGDSARQGPAFITVRGMATAYRNVGTSSLNQVGVWVGPGSKHIALENIDAGSVDSWFADHLTVRGGDYGPCNAVGNYAANVCGNNKLDVSTNVTITGALFHDYRFDQSCFDEGADCHWECMFVNGGVNVSIRNSKFRDCALMDIFATISGPDAAAIGHRNLAIENNWFDTPWNESRSGPTRSRPSAVVLAACWVSPGYRDVRIRFNSFHPTTRLEHDSTIACSFENVRVIGNLMMWDGCDSRYTYAYNLWSTTWRRGTCSATDKIGARTFPYANQESGSNFNFHLRQDRRTLADDLVPASVAGGCPTRDMDQQRRPLQKRCDAGADERIFVTKKKPRTRR